MNEFFLTNKSHAVFLNWTLSFLLCVSYDLINFVDSFFVIAIFKELFVLRELEFYFLKLSGTTPYSIR